MKSHSLERVGTLTAGETLATTRAAEQLDLYGAPSPNLPSHVREAVLAAIDKPPRAPSRGDSDLRAAAARWVTGSSGHTYDPETEVLVTNGAMQGLFVCFQALLKTGDRVLLPSPSFFFGNLVAMAGAEPVYVPTSQSNGWHWDVDQLEGAIDSRTRAIVVCNPCNPTGYVPTAEQVERLALLAARHDLLVVTDESYERFLYDGRQLASLASQTDIADRLVVIRSMSKSFGMPGWRIGFVLAQAPILERCLAVFEWTSLRCSLVAQRAAWAALDGPKDWLSKLVGHYQSNRDLAFAAINATKRLSCCLPESCPFLFVDVSLLEDADAHTREDHLLRLGIPIVPGRHFMAADSVRLPFGGESTTIELLGRRLSAV